MSDWSKTAARELKVINYRNSIHQARELQAAGRIDEAESVFQELSHSFPGEYDAALDYALIAYSKQNWVEALLRFQAVLTRFPEVITGYRYVGDLLFAQGRFDEADAVILDGMARFPEEDALVISYAWSAHFKGDQDADWYEASNRWRVLNSTCPNVSLGANMLSFCLMRYLGKADEAECVLVDAMRRFPDDVDIAVQHARVADYKRDWAEAMRRWDALVARWPNVESIREGRGETEARLRFDEIENEDHSTIKLFDYDSYPQTEADKNRHLMMQFESLGENCEFGLLQRRYGAEPLGLLRWVASSPEQLCVALEDKFAEFNRLEDFEIELRGPEYFLNEIGYLMHMHTFIVKSEYKGSQEQLRRQLFRRMVYLKSKLLDDLRSAEKIFVWQSGVGSLLSDDTILRMHRALRSYGKNTLLAVRRHNNPSKDAAVELRLPGLIVGSLHQTEVNVGSDGSERVSSPFVAWLSLCRLALEMRADENAGE